MDKLTSTARKIDIVFRIAEIALKIAFVTCLVCLAIIAVGTIFNLPDEMIGFIDGQLEFGPLTLHVPGEHLPSFDDFLLYTAPMLVMGAAVSFVGILCVKTIRAILAPMKEGKPFSSEISKHLRRLGWLSLILGLAVQVMEAVSLFIIAGIYRLDTLLLSEKITGVDISPSFDLSVLIIPAVFFLLAYVFRYGAELQQLSDETL